MVDNIMMHSNDCKCFSWKPVLAGALTAIGLTFLLNLFSVAIGLTAYTTSSDGVESLAMGGLLGTAIGIVASMFASGWLAGYLGQRYCSKGHLGAFYGFLAWCVALIAGVFLAAHMQQYISFYNHFISGTSADTVASVVVANKKAIAVIQNIQVNKLVISTYVLFILFFLSALASSLGGDLGMRYAARH